MAVCVAYGTLHQGQGKHMSNVCVRLELKKQAEDAAEGLERMPFCARVCRHADY